MGWKTADDWAPTQRLWKPGIARNRRSLQGLVQDLTNNGELVIEFAVRVLLGQDLRLAKDWVPLLKATNGYQRQRPKGTRGTTKADSADRLRQIKRAVAAMPDPPEITMEDRRWAAQLLLAYGWGLPSRTPPNPDPPGAQSALAFRAAEIVEEFQPAGAEEEARLARILAVLEPAREPVPLTQGADGTYVELGSASGEKKP